MGLTRMKYRFVVGVLLCLVILYIPTFYSLYEERRIKSSYKGVTYVHETTRHSLPEGFKSKPRRHRGHSDVDSDLESDSNQTDVTNLTSTQYYEKAGNNGYFCIKARGRLGSALSHLATLHAIIRETKRKPVFCPKNGPISVLRDTFKAIIRPYDECFQKCPQVINIKSRSRYDPTLIPRIKSVPLNISLRLPGTIFSWKYFDKYRDEIRRMFRINDRYLHYADKFIADINSTHENQLEPDTTFVCIHIRRTDRLGTKDLKKGHVFPESKYFNSAVSYYEENYEHPHFIVCSDDIRWCKENLKIPGATFSTSNNYKDDFAILSRCNHSIITFGHFSWWGGFLAGGRVVYPSNVTKPGSHYAVKDMDRMPDSWIGL